MFGFRAKISDRFKNLVKNINERIDQHIENNVRGLVSEIHADIQNVTPVWSGRTIANFQWGNTPATNSIDPVRDGPVGEGRRSSNAAISDATLRGLNYRQKIYIVNNSRYPDGKTYLDMEYGRMPTATTSRVPPQGIIRMALAKHPTKKVVSPSIVK